MHVLISSHSDWRGLISTGANTPSITGCSVISQLGIEAVVSTPLLHLDTLCSKILPGITDPSPLCFHHRCSAAAHYLPKETPMEQFFSTAGTAYCICNFNPHHSVPTAFQSRQAEILKIFPACSGGAINKSIFVPSLLAG